MKILFAVQGTGNGHLSRAREILPHLQAYGEVSLLVSGTHAEAGQDLPIRYRHRGMGFIFGTQGGVDVLKSLQQARPITFLRDLCRMPLNEYDVLLNDFEPLTAYAAKKQGRKIIGMSHQAAFLSPKTPRPPQANGLFAEWLFRHYAPCAEQLGFHFKSYDNFITTPVIRQEIRKQPTTAGDHITVYLPAYSDKVLLAIFEKIPEIKWHVFSKHSNVAFRFKNVSVMPIDQEAYVQSLSNSAGLLTGGGFEAPAEALFLGKKVFTIPMSNQFEQQCNAQALLEFGCGTHHVMNTSTIAPLKAWLKQTAIDSIHFPDHTPQSVAHVMRLAGKMA